MSRSMAASHDGVRQATGNLWRDTCPKTVITLNTGLEDAETVTVAFLVAVGAAEQGRQTLIFLTKEAVRLATEGFARAVACEGCPPLADLVQRYEKAGGRFLVCPICMQARHVDPSGFAANA